MRTDGLVYYGNLYNYSCDRYGNDRMLIFKVDLNTPEYSVCMNTGL